MPTVPVRMSSLSPSASDPTVDSDEEFVFVGLNGLDETRMMLEKQLARKRDLDKLEESMRVMAQLYEEVNDAIEQQRQEIHAAEEPITEAQQSTHEARLQIEEARKLKKSTQKKKRCLSLYSGFVVTVIILVIIIVV